MEYRDLYNEQKILTGEIIEKNGIVPHGRYYITVVVFIENSKGEILLQKRSVEKGGQWATTGGHPKSGETSVQGICTEIQEELGFVVQNQEVVLFGTRKTEDDFVDLYYLKKDIAISTVKIQEEEVQDVKWFSKNEINKMIKNKTFFKWHIDFYNDFLNYIDK